MGQSDAMSWPKCEYSGNRADEGGLFCPPIKRVSFLSARLQQVDHGLAHRQADIHVGLGVATIMSV